MHHTACSSSGTSLSCSEKLTDTKQRDAGQWLLDTFYVAESGSVSKAEVYAAYLVYCSRDNEEPFSRAVFGRLVVYKAFPSLKTRRQGRRGQVRYHYMRLQFVRLSTRPPKSMWENSSDDSDSDSSRRKRKRGRPIRTLASSKRGKVSAGSSAPIPASTKTSKVTAEETYEEETGIVWTEFLSQPSTPSCAAPCCVSSEDQGAQSFYNSCDGFVAALGQRSLPSLLQQPPAPWADVGECMTTTSDYPACGALAPSFPLDGASLSYLDFTNNTNTCVDNFWG